MVAGLKPGEGEENQRCDKDFSQGFTPYQTLVL